MPVSPCSWEPDGSAIVTSTEPGLFGDLQVGLAGRIERQHVDSGVGAIVGGDAHIGDDEAETEPNGNRLGCVEGRHCLFLTARCR
jgi:hypothetical protein